MQLQQLVYFRTVAEAGSFNKAADKLFTTQPNLSKAIRGLEQELKVDLFRRTNRGAVLTEAGRKLYRYAGTIMDQMELIRNLGSAPPSQVLSVAAYPSVMMGELVSSFYRSHPDVSLKLTEVRLQRLMEMVEEGDAELGFVLYNHGQDQELRRMLRMKGLVLCPLGMDTWYVNLGPNHPLYDREEVTMTELLAYPVVRQPDDYFSNLTFYLEIDGVCLTGFRRVLYANDGGTILTLLRTTDAFRFGAGMSAAAFAAYGVRTVPIRNCHVQVTTGWVRRRRETLSKEGEELVAHLQTLLYPAGITTL